MNTAHSIRMRRLATAARIFVLLALAVPVLWAWDTASLPFLGAIAVVWAVAGIYDLRVAEPRIWPTLVEAGLVGLVCALGISVSPGLLVALVVPPFLAGLRHGNDGATEAVAAEMVSVVGISISVYGGMSASTGMAVFTWAVMGLGLGLVAGFVRSSRQEPDSEAAYRAARRLLAELVDLSGGLSAGLDSQALGASMITAVRDRIPSRSVTLHVQRGQELTPLLRDDHGEAEDHELDDRLAAQAARSGQLQLTGRAFALPLHAEDGIVAVVAGTLSPDLLPDQIGLRALLDGYAPDLASIAVRLDTALLFARFRDEATADERRRLAREMHDGVAQDIASMGYFVDSLIAGATSPQQAQQLQMLRDQITSVVAEVRRHVLTLRSQMEGNESLGAAIGSLARHLSAISGVAIKVTVDESTTRLRPEIEAELLRIAQESLNNAVRHAEASLIEVTCRVNPPEAEILVEDDGRGLGQKRVDSHGLEIMHERARLIGAELHIGNRPSGGTRVSVHITGDVAAASPAFPRTKETVA